jgi:cytochrome c peroxidase
MKIYRLAHPVAIALAALSLSTAALGQSSVQSVVDTQDPSGVLRTISLNGGPVIDSTNPFFLSLGTNGRSCVSCHVASTAWTISPEEVQDRFVKTQGLDPIFRTNDGSNSPLADVSTVAARRKAYSMLLEKGVIRIGLPIPAGAEFELVGVQDPYNFASAAQLSLFRRPLPATNLRFLTGVMWDGRESFAPSGTLPILTGNTPQQNAFSLFFDLKHQANDATVGHAQGSPLTDEQMTAIANFELNLATAQQVERRAGDLDDEGAYGGPVNLAGQTFYVTINDVLGADVMNHTFNPDSMTLFQAWANSRNETRTMIARGAKQFGSKSLYQAWARSRDKTRASIARGAKLFGTKPIKITDVGGLNDDLNMPVIQGTCTTCHDSPNVGNHSVALPIDIGLTDSQFRTSDMPLYTLRNVVTGQTRKTSDPGRALLTGKWKDIGKFKGPVLRGLSGRAPYFHNGLGTDFGAVIDFYNTRFRVGITDEEKEDFIAFLGAL